MFEQKFIIRDTECGNIVNSLCGYKLSDIWNALHCKVFAFIEKMNGKFAVVLTLLDFPNKEIADKARSLLHQWIDPRPSPRYLVVPLTV